MGLESCGKQSATNGSGKLQTNFQTGLVYGRQTILAPISPPYFLLTPYSLPGKILMTNKLTNRRRFIGTIAATITGVAASSFTPVFGADYCPASLDKTHEFAPDQKLVIGLWVPPPRHLSQTEADMRMRFKQIADAGINMVWGVHLPYSFDDAMMPKVLDACLEYGLEILLDIKVRATESVEAELARCLQDVNKYKDHPAVRGFSMCDEPGASVFDRLAVIRREVDAVLPSGKHTTANLFPNYAPTWALGTPDYDTHVEEYMQKVRPQVLSFDFYPLTAAGNADGPFISNLITIRNAAIKYNVPFWGFIQAIGWNGMREPVYDEYRWLCNAHIAFGAKGFSYFLYAMPYDGGGPEGFTNAMLAWDGNLTHLYDYAKNINKELSGFSHKFMPFVQDGFIPVNLDAQLVQAIPGNLLRDSYGPLSKIETSGEMLNGCFELNGQKAVYFFNWARDNSMSAKLTFDGTVNFQLWGKDGLETQATASELNVSLIPGEAKFLIFD